MNWNFQKGREGGSKQNTFHGRGMEIFWNYRFFLNYRPDSAFLLLSYPFVTSLETEALQEKATVTKSMNSTGSCYASITYSLRTHL